MMKGKTTMMFGVASGRGGRGRGRRGEWDIVFSSKRLGPVYFLSRQ